MFSFTLIALVSVQVKTKLALAHPPPNQALAHPPWSVLMCIHRLWCIFTLIARWVDFYTPWCVYNVNSTFDCSGPQPTFCRPPVFADLPLQLSILYLHFLLCTKPELFMPNMLVEHWNILFSHDAPLFGAAHPSRKIINFPIFQLHCVYWVYWVVFIQPHPTGYSLKVSTYAQFANHQLPLKSCVSQILGLDTISW